MEWQRAVGFFLEQLRLALEAAAIDVTIQVEFEQERLCWSIICQAGRGQVFQNVCAFPPEIKLSVYNITSLLSMLGDRTSFMKAFILRRAVFQGDKSKARSSLTLVATAANFFSTFF